MRFLVEIVYEVEARNFLRHVEDGGDVEWNIGYHGEVGDYAVIGRIAVAAADWEPGPKPPDVWEKGIKRNWS